MLYIYITYKVMFVKMIIHVEGKTKVVDTKYLSNTKIKM